jgi:hypothetical protein
MPKIPVVVGRGALLEAIELWKTEIPLKKNQGTTGHE